MLVDEGYDNLTIELVAARAGAGKATIYRRWASKAELVIDALSLVKPQMESVDTGSLSSDLDALVSIACSKHGAFATSVMCGVASALGRDPDLLAAFRERSMEPRIRRIREVLQRARDRGELDDSIDIDFAATIVPSLVLQHTLQTGCAIDRAYTQQVVDDVLRPMLRLPAPTTKASR